MLGEEEAGDASADDEDGGWGLGGHGEGIGKDARDIMSRWER